MSVKLVNSWSDVGTATHYESEEPLWYRMPGRKRRARGYVIERGPIGIQINPINARHGVVWITQAEIDAAKPKTKA